MTVASDQGLIQCSFICTNCGLTSVNSRLGDDQFGFRKDMGARDAIGSVRPLTERNCQSRHDIYIALRRMGIDWRDRRLIGNLYIGQKIRIDGEHSEPGNLGRGMRQRFLLLLLLFIIYIEELVREAVDDKEGVKVGGRWIKALRFADDQVIMARSQRGLQTMMNRCKDK